MRQTHPVISRRGFFRRCGQIAATVAIARCAMHSRRALAQGADYVPPLGIPTGYWGVDEADPAAPASWSAGTPSATAGSYYIDPSHGSATDSGNTYGHPDLPRLTVPTSLAAGSYVEVHGATTITGDVTWACSGTEESPVFILGVGGATFTKTGGTSEIALTGSYVRLRNVELVNLKLSFGPDGGAAIDHACFHTIEIHEIEDDGGTVIGVGEQATREAACHHLTVYNCYLHDNGPDVPPEVQADLHGFKAGTDSRAHHLWFLETDTNNNSGDSVQMGSATATGGHTDWPQYIYIGNSTSHTEGENSYDFKKCRHVVVSGCTGANYAVSGGSGGTAFVIHNGSENVWCINTKFSDSVQGPTLTEQAECFFIGVISHDLTERGIYPNSGGGTCHIYNCTFARSGDGIRSTGGGPPTILARNNIIFDCTTGDTFRISNSTGAAAATITHHCMWEAGAADLSIVLGGSSFTTVAALIAGSVHGDNSIQEDPLFTDAAADDFSLQADSPCRGIGYDWRSVATTAYNSTIGADSGQTLTDDDWVDVNGEPFGSSPDLGAIQFADSTPPVAGAPPAAQMFLTQ